MAKLPKKFQFIDLSDYGRPAGSWIAKRFQYTSITPIHVTTMFIISGLIAIGFMLNEYYITAAFFIILKSILDAADGELSRLKNTPKRSRSTLGNYCLIIVTFVFISIAEIDEQRKLCRLPRTVSCRVCTTLPADALIK